MFGPYEMMKRSLEQFDKTVGLGDDEFQHILVDQHYPILRESIKSLIAERGEIKNTLVVDPGKNIGLANGVNFALKSVPLTNDDLVILFDPDMNPITVGWGRAMKSVHQEKSVAWTTCLFDGAKSDMNQIGKGFKAVTINGIDCRKIVAPVINSCCMLKASFLIASGGAHESNPYYGGFECHMWPYLVKNNLSWVFLEDYWEDCSWPELRCQNYAEYKVATTHGGEKQVEFTEWVMEKEKKRMLERKRATEGWCPDSKAIRLYDLILEKKPKVIVEIGVYGGQSLVALAAAAEQIDDAKVFGFDPYNDEECQQYDLNGSKIDHGKIDWVEIERKARETIAPYKKTKLFSLPGAYA